MKVKTTRFPVHIPNRLCMVLPCCCTWVQITRGLLQKHGAERVRDTPITEVRTQALQCWRDNSRKAAQHLQLYGTTQRRHTSC
jgi:hypothetical protein